MLAYIIVFFLFQLPHAGLDQDEVETMGDFHAPSVGPVAPMSLEDPSHPVGYVGRPGCYMHQMGKEQHAFSFDNDARRIWLTDFRSGSVYSWHCRGFMPHKQREQKR